MILSDSNNTMSTATLVANLQHMIRVKNFGTATTLAKAAGLPPSTLTRVMTGEVQNPQIDVLRKIGAALNIPWWALYATDLSRVELDLIDWDQLLSQKNEQIKLSSDSVQVGIDTARQCIRAIVEFKGSSNFNEAELNQLAESVGKQVVKGLILAGQAQDHQDDLTQAASA